MRRYFSALYFATIGGISASFDGCGSLFPPKSALLHQNPFSAHHFGGRGDCGYNCYHQNIVKPILCNKFFWHLAKRESAPKRISSPTKCNTKRCNFLLLNKECANYICCVGKRHCVLWPERNKTWLCSYRSPPSVRECHVHFISSGLPKLCALDQGHDSCVKLFSKKEYI